MASVAVTIAVAFFIALSVSVSVEGSGIGGIINRFCNPFTAATGAWNSGTATFYSGGRGGACGFGSLGYLIYGERYAAVSTRLWGNGGVCGQCLEIKCTGPRACRPGSVKVTVTDFCPNTYPNLAHCGVNKNHIDMGRNAFPVIANPRIGVINVQYRVVPCAAYNFIRVTINGNRYGWMSLLIASVPGTGRIFAVDVKGSGSRNWENLRRTWGANYHRSGRLLVAPITVRISLFGRLCKVVAPNCIPRNFRYGQTVQCRFQSSL